MTDLQGGKWWPEKNVTFQDLFTPFHGSHEIVSSKFVSIPHSTQYPLGCPGFFKSWSWKPIFCPGLDIYLRSHQKKFEIYVRWFVEWPCDFVYTKEWPKKYKGKYAVRPFLLSFLLGRSNQLNSFTRILHFHCRFRRHPYRSHLWPYIHMTIWPYGQNMVIWPFDHMTKMAQNGIDMSVSWNSNKNVAFWWRN